MGMLTRVRVKTQQGYFSMMCGCFSIGITDFMCKGKSLTKFTNICSPHEW